MLVRFEHRTCCIYIHFSGTCICVYNMYMYMYVQANDGNVEIASEETMDVIGLRLLSTHRNFENVSSYGPSSSH